MICQENKWINSIKKVPIEHIKSKEIYLNILFPIPLSIKIVTDNNSLISDLVSIYECSSRCLYKKASTIFILNKENYLPYKTEIQNVGIVHKNNVFFYCKPDIGLIKSVLYGIYSKHLTKKGFFPIHGTFIKIDNQYIVFYGGQNVGKSSILNYFSEITNYSFGTDDWLVAKLENNKLVGYVVEKTISMFGKEFLNKENCFNSLTYPQKKYIKRENIHKTYFDKSEISKLFYLNRDGKKQITKISNKKFVKTIVDTAYHCPIINTNEFTDFWNKVFFILSPIHELDIKSTNIEELKKAIANE